MKEEPATGAATGSPEFTSLIVPLHADKAMTAAGLEAMQLRFANGDVPEEGAIIRRVFREMARAAPQPPGPVGEHPWDKARRLGRELSATLAEADEGRWLAEILPAGNEYPIRFGAFDHMQEDGPRRARVDRMLAFLEGASPHTRVLYHASELATACEDMKGGGWGAIFDWPSGKVVVTSGMTRE